MGKGNDPNCAMASSSMTADAQQPAERLAARCDQQARQLQDRFGLQLPSGWGVWEVHMEPGCTPMRRSQFTVVFDELHRRYPEQVRKLEVAPFSAEQEAVIQDREDPQVQLNTYLAVYLPGGRQDQLSEALQELDRIARGEGELARKVRTEQAFARVQYVTDRVRLRALRVKGMPPEEDLPEDWVDQLVQTLRDEDLGEIDNTYDHGIIRRSLGVHKWGDKEVSENSIQAAARHLGWID